MEPCCKCGHEIPKKYMSYIGGRLFCSGCIADKLSNEEQRHYEFVKQLKTVIANDQTIRVIQNSPGIASIQSDKVHVIDPKRKLSAREEGKNRESQFLRIRELVPDFAPKVVNKSSMWGVEEPDLGLYSMSSDYVRLYLEDCARELASSFFWFNSEYLIEAGVMGTEYRESLIPRYGLTTVKCRGKNPLEALASMDGLKAIAEVLKERKEE